jgi:GNAT superfamily N-acetyltransferase
MKKKTTRIEKAFELGKNKEYLELFKATIKTLIPRKILYFDKLYIVRANSLKLPFTGKTDFTHRLASASDISTISSVYGEPGKFKRRFKNKSTCILAELNDEVAGVIWINLSDKYKTNCEYVYEPDDKAAWIFDLYIVPKYRLRGAFVYLMNVVLQYVQDQSYTALSGEIHYANKASINAHIRIGFKIIETISYVSILGLYMYSIKSDELIKNRLHFKYVTPIQH